MPDPGMSMQYHTVKGAADGAATIAGNLSASADQAEPGMMALAKTHPSWKTSAASAVVAGAHLHNIRETASGLYIWHGHAYASIAAVQAADNANGQAIAHI